MATPKHYGTYEDFQREELYGSRKLGFSLDDLESEETFRPGRETLEEEPQELDFTRPRR